jgi:hypothetical protein
MPGLRELLQVLMTQPQERHRLTVSFHSVLCWRGKGGREEGRGGVSLRKGKRKEEV